MRVSYRFRRRDGAVLHLPLDAHCEDAQQRTLETIKRYMKENVQSWFDFAEENYDRFGDVENIVLVTGYTVVKSWAAAVSVIRKSDAKISLESQSLPNERMNLQWHVEDNFAGVVPRHTSVQGQVCCLGHIDATHTNLSSIL
jgi:hypothetical protein